MTNSVSLTDSSWVEIIAPSASTDIVYIVLESRYAARLEIAASLPSDSVNGGTVLEKESNPTTQITLEPGEGLYGKSIAGPTRITYDTVSADADSSGSSVDPQNSSTTPLGISGVFTGEWTDLISFEAVMVAVATDADGAYSLQFSPDGVNTDSALARYYRTGQINAPHRFTATRRYCRVVYTNGSAAQTYFRLQVILGSFHPLNAPTDGVLSRDFDATVVRPTIPHDEIVLGLRQGREAFLKFGYREGITNSATPVVLAPFAATWSRLSTASTLTIVSTSANDDGSPVGTGARTILISGIDANRDNQVEVVTMNGTTSVVTASTWLGINRVVVLTVGSLQVNEGTITITATTGGSPQAVVPAGASVTQQLIFFTKAGHSALLKKVYINALKISGGASPRVTIRLRVWNPGVTNAIYTLRRYKLDTGVSNDLERDVDPPILLNPTDVVWLDVTSDQNNTVVDADMKIIEVKQAAT